ncbi:hypothetical protein [Novosphingobium sp.]|uniref:hypothetical protein n=1 Tax=Novosphingobium sp. TaxID=1874826 RepID=UPI002FDD33E4
MSNAAAVPSVAPASGPADAVAHADQAWRTMRGMGDIQFAPVTPPPPDPPYVPPHWLEVIARAIGRVLVWLGDHVLGPLGLGLARGWNLLLLLVIIAGAAALLWLAWGALAPWLRALRDRRQADPEWTPAPAAALALLEDADRLAEAGQYEEAVHLLLRRSVADIVSARPDWVAPSSTAREIAGLAALPAAARRAFTVMADEVERARYALRAAGRSEWDRARAAYAAFALERLA